MKLVASIENELTIVLPRGSLIIDKGGTKIGAGILFTPILHDYGIELVLKLVDMQVVVFE